MGAAQYDELVIEQGSTFKMKLVIRDGANALVDLTGETWRGQVRKVTGDAALLAAFTCTILNQVTNKGEVEVSLSDTVSAAIPVPKGTDKKPRGELLAQYDIERVKVSLEVERVVQGKATIIGEATI